MIWTIILLSVFILISDALHIRECISEEVGPSCHESRWSKKPQQHQEVEEDQHDGLMETYWSQSIVFAA